MATSNKSVTAGAEKARLAVAAVRRTEHRKRVAIWGAVAAVGAALIVVTAILIASSLHQRDVVVTEAAGDIAGVTATSGLTANHVPNLPEPTPTNGVRVPPVGGDHDEVPQTCGVYDEPVGTWHAVHSLEHGSVWITYAPDLAADQIATLASDAKGHDHVLVSPFPDQPTPVILTAWGLQLRVDSASDPRVEVFIAKYENGPQTPEPGAACEGTTAMTKP